ncbi:hypothetical protein ACH4E7_41565 [Kitasatospora sp. NPDC018058]|uniref:hypothetical protein n=1 Tax=Kitasatospora sp. NPDC018058 TaxID=3364025 RepID=UPI0037C16FBE
MSAAVVVARALTAGGRAAPDGQWPTRSAVEDLQLPHRVVDVRPQAAGRPSVSSSPSVDHGWTVSPLLQPLIEDTLSATSK